MLVGTTFALGVVALVALLVASSGSATLDDAASEVAALEASWQPGLDGGLAYASAGGTATRSAAPARDVPETASQSVPASETEADAYPPLESGTVLQTVPRGLLTYTLGDGTYATVQAGNPTVLVDSPAREVSRTLTSGARGDVYASPDGQFVATVYRDEQGTRIDVTAGFALVGSFLLAAPEGDQLVNGGKGPAAAVSGVPLNIEWSPDSRYLAFGSITGAPWALNVLSVEAWRLDRYAIEGGYVGELAWSPGSDLLAISTYEIDRRDHNVLIFDPRTRAVSYLIDGCEIVWAPDGRYLAVHREPRIEPGVWITSADGETRIRATDDPMAFPISWVESSA